MSSLLELATQLRAMQLLAHIGHNRVSGPTFFEDHEFLGGLYGTYEGLYDSIVERMIGLGETPDLKSLNAAANKTLQSASAGTGSVEYLTQLLAMEKEVCELVETAVEEGELSQATINLIVQIADDSEARQYKMQQRLGKLSVEERPEDALDRLAEAKRKKMESEED